MSTGRKLFSLVVAVSLLTLSVVAFAGHRTAPRTSDHAAQVSARPLASNGQPTSGWVHEGCWEASQSGPCYDIYRDASGNYWKCSQCGTTKNPGPNKCSQISLQALNQGYWCS